VIPRRLCILMVLLSITTALLAGPALAGNAQADRAKAMLNRGLAEFKALNFKAAKTTLKKVSKDALSESDKKVLAEYLTKADLALRKQMQAAQEYIAAEEALRNNDLTAAKRGFEAAAANPYLHTQTRRDARARLAEVMAKMEAFGQTQTTEATRQEEPAEASQAEPTVEATAKTSQPALSVVQAAPIQPAQQLSPEEELEAILNNHDHVMARAEAKEPQDLDAELGTVESPAIQATPQELAPAQAQAVEQPTEPQTLVVAQASPQVPGQTSAKPSLLQRLAAQRRQTEPQAAAESVQTQPQPQPSQVAPAVEEPIRQQRPQSLQPQPLPGRGRPEPVKVTQSYDILNRLQQKRRIAKQVANVEFENAMSKSQDALAGELSREAFDKAASMARTAKNILEQNKRLYSSSEYQQKLARCEDQLKYIELRRNEWQKALIEQQTTQIEQDRLERIRRQEEQRKRQIQTLQARAQTLISEENHEEALELVKQILKLDPKDKWAGAQLELLEQLVLLKEEKRVDRLATVEEAKVLIDLRESEIPWYDYLRYPRNWRELSMRRRPYAAGEVSESEADMLVHREMAKVTPEITMDEMSLENAIDFLREMSGLSIHVKWGVLENAGIPRDAPVTVHLSNVTFEKALRTILDDVGGLNPLGYIVDGGVITISTRADLSGTAYATTRVHDIRDLIFRVPIFQGQPMNLQTSTGNAAGGGAIGFGNVGVGNQVGNNQGATRQDVINNIITLIEETIDPDSWRPAGQIGSIRELHGQLVITQTAENQRRIAKLINQLRESKMMLINVETRFLSVNTGFLQRIGLDLDFFLNLGSTLGPGQIITDPNTGATLSPNPQLPGGSWTGKPGNDKWTPIGILQNNSFTNITTSPFGTGSIAAAVTSSALSVAGTFLDDIQVNFLLEATQAHEATRSLIAPRVTLFNGQRSNIQLLTQTPYVTEYEQDTTTTGTGNVVTTTDVTTGTINEGISLDLEATISADRRYVILTVQPQITELIGFRDVPGAEPIEFPELSSQALATTVSIPDGGTLLLGGLKKSAEVEREMGVPLLSKIPVINRAFTNRGKVRDEQTLLILIRPKIIIHREMEEENFPPGA